MPAPLKLHPEADPRLANSFKNFLWKTWHSLGFTDPTPLQYDMADYLQFGGNRKVMMAFRGAAKSYITVPYCLWNLYRNQDIKVLATSATGKFAANNAQFAYTMLTSFDWLAWLKPRSDQRQSALEFDVNGSTPAKDASFAAVGMFGQITGRRSDLIVPDDAETPNTSDTEGSRADLRRAIEEFGAVIKPGGEITYLGTAQHEDTIYLELEDKGYALRMWPAIYPKPEHMAKYGSRLAPMLVRDLEENPHLAGTSTEPTRFDEPDLEQRQIDFGSLEWERQFLLWLDAGAATSKQLRLSQATVMDLTPDGGVPASVQWSSMKDYKIVDIEADYKTGDGLFGPAEAKDFGKPDGTVCIIDPSGAGHDETSWTIGSVKNARVFAQWQGASLDGTSDDVLTQIAADCKKWGVQEIIIESNFGQGMLSALLRPKLQEIKHNVTITEKAAGKVSKEVRIVNALQPVLSAHRLVINADLLRNDYNIPYTSVKDGRRRFYRLTYQLTRITREKDVIAFDDRVETLANLVSHFQEHLRQRTEDAEKRDQEQKLQDEADKIIATRKKQGLTLFGLEKEKSLVGMHNKGRTGSKAVRPNKGRPIK